MTPINMHHQTLAPVLSLEVIEKSILPMMDTLVSDDIPNIRFNVAKSYAILISVLRRLPATGDVTIAGLEKEGKELGRSPEGEELIHDKILPNLEKLQQDDDVDVRYFATTAAAGFNGAGGGEEMES
jgi:serine/threonine-protein phosphatase 2A regulatory subunit A